MREHFTISRVAFHYVGAGDLEVEAVDASSKTSLSIRDVGAGEAVVYSDDPEVFRRIAEEANHARRMCEARQVAAESFELPLGRAS